MGRIDDTLKVGDFVVLNERGMKNDTLKTTLKNKYGVRPQYKITSISDDNLWIRFDGERTGHNRLCFRRATTHFLDEGLFTL